MTTKLRPLMRSKKMEAAWAGFYMATPFGRSAATPRTRERQLRKEGLWHLSCRIPILNIWLICQNPSGIKPANTTHSMPSSSFRSASFRPLRIVLRDILVIGGLAMIALSPGTVRAAGPHHPPSLDAAPADKYGALVRLGHKIFTDTPKNAPRYAGNRLSCSNCHLDAGRKADAAPMWAAYGAYPSWRAKDDRVSSFEERVQQCFRFSLDGIPPAFGSIELQAITVYAHYLATGTPIGVDLPGRGFPDIPRTGQDPNPDRGRTVYGKHCLSCHGESGAGLPGIPPLWGRGSYNKGAGMANVRTAAAFIRANMPLG
ncbi:MAG: c-type cytochrome, partial [Rhodocyclaceae bacterium]|nr:c-type cytochrome [Rhodocyclaceae bacterium]